MEITYKGQACFNIKGRETSIVIDPFEEKVDTDMLLCTNKSISKKAAKGSTYRLLIEGPGEYETRGVFVNGLQIEKNTIFQIDIDGFTILHMDSVNKELPQEVLQKISDVDVLMIPVEDPKIAHKIILAIDPGYVIPMKFESLEKFLDEMGVEEDLKKEAKLSISSKSDIPEDTEVMVL